MADKTSPKDNIVLSCSPCNSRKGLRTYARFLELMAEEEKALEMLKAEDE